jgi:hypothetical protein
MKSKKKSAPAKKTPGRGGAGRGQGRKKGEGSKTISLRIPQRHLDAFETLEVKKMSPMYILAMDAYLQTLARAKRVDEGDKD